MNNQIYTYNKHNLAWKGKSRRGKNKHVLTYLLITSVAIVSFVYVASRGIDKTIQNQDVMLCESALVSGNREYKAKCQCYYNTDDITCIQKGGEVR